MSHTATAMTLSYRLYVLSTIVDRYQLDCDATINGDGFTLAGDFTDTLPDLTMAFILERDLSIPDREVYRGKTLDDFPVIVEQRRA